MKHELCMLDTHKVCLDSNMSKKALQVFKISQNTMSSVINIKFSFGLTSYKKLDLASEEQRQDLEEKINKTNTERGHTVLFVYTLLQPPTCCTFPFW